MIKKQTRLAICAAAVGLAVIVDDAAAAVQDAEISQGSAAAGLSQDAEPSIAQFADFDDASTQTVDYGPVDEILAAITVRAGSRQNFRYSQIKGRGATILRSYARSMAASAPTRLSRNEQLAFWLNLRNMLVIASIADDNPRRSLKNDRGELATPGEMWTEKRITVEGVELSIDDIERGIILANWNDPDVIYGLYQGIKGGPAFSPAETFKGQDVQAQLAERAGRFINARGFARVRRGELQAPGIYEWYRDALFNGDDQAILEHFRAHAQERLTQKLDEASSVTYKKVDYRLDREEVRQQQQPGQNAPSSGGIGSGS